MFLVYHIEILLLFARMVSSLLILTSVQSVSLQPVLLEQIASDHALDDVGIRSLRLGQQNTGRYWILAYHHYYHH